jgi:hypothetical protein
LLDTNLATKGITEHTSAAIFETSSGSKWVPSCSRSDLFKQPSHSILLSQLKLPWLSRINQHTSTLLNTWFMEHI